MGAAAGVAPAAAYNPQPMQYGMSPPQQQQPYYPGAPATGMAYPPQPQQQYYGSPMGAPYGQPVMAAARPGMMPQPQPQQSMSPGAAPPGATVIMVQGATATAVNDAKPGGYVAAAEKVRMLSFCGVTSIPAVPYALDLRSSYRG
jgi:hypothetical protein